MEKNVSIHETYSGILAETRVHVNQNLGMTLLRPAKKVGDSTRIKQKPY